MEGERYWEEVISITTAVEEMESSGIGIKDVKRLLDDFKEKVEFADENSRGLLFFVFHKSILPALNISKLSPTLILSIFSIFLQFTEMTEIPVSILDDMTDLISIVLKEQLNDPQELFEEISNAGFQLLKRLTPLSYDINAAAFPISVSLEYSTKHGQSLGLDALDYLETLLSKSISDIKPVFPGVSVGLTAVATNVNNRHKVVCHAMQILGEIWTNTKLDEKDIKNVKDLLNRICAINYDHPKIRAARVILCGRLLQKRDLSDLVPPSVRVLFAGVADSSDSVRDTAKPIVESIGGDLIISGEFEKCVDELNRVAKVFDDSKRLLLLQTIAGVMQVNEGKDNGFEDQLLTSLFPLAIALLNVSEIELGMTKLVEIEGGFILRMRPYLSSPQHQEAFKFIVDHLPAEPFVEVLIDILAEAPSRAPEVFSMFEAIASRGPADTMCSVIEQNQWWTIDEPTPKKILTLEMAIQVSSVLVSSEVYWVILYRILECLSSEYSTVKQTAMATLVKMAPDGDVSALLSSNVDYIADRLIARLQYIDVSPETLTVFSAILGIEGDISILVSHLIPRIFELLETRDSFSLVILRLLPRVLVKLPSHAEQIVDKSIHFILSSSQQHQCAAIDSIIAALPLIPDEEKLLPMVHQSWLPIIKVLQVIADPASPVGYRSIEYMRTILMVSRSFVKNRIRDECGLFLKHLTEMLDRLRAYAHNSQAIQMSNSLFALIQDSYDGETVFYGLELEIFQALLQCFDADLPAFIRDKALTCLKSLYLSSPTFIWVLMIEASTPVKERKTRFLGEVSKGSAVAMASLLNTA